MEKEQSEDPAMSVFYEWGGWSVPHGKRVFFP